MKFIIIVFLAAAALVSFNGCTKADNQQNMHSGETVDSSLIRPAGADIAALDANGDGKLFQCPMHYKVISDTFASCPLCKMDLEEHAVTEVSDNFDK